MSGLGPENCKEGQVPGNTPRLGTTSYTRVSRHPKQKETKTEKLDI